MSPDSCWSCPNGHSLEGQNLYLYKGRYHCRVCKRLDTRRRRTSARGISPTRDAAPVGTKEAATAGFSSFVTNNAGLPGTNAKS